MDENIESPQPLPAHITLNCPDDSLLRLVTVLQSGFLHRCRQGETIFSCLLGLKGFTREYIDKEIQTIFYNGDALDDLEAELSGDRPIIALSSAMPGLAGAILKRNSPCGILRKTRTVEHSGAADRLLDVVIKLFNTVALDRGPTLFQQGIIIKSSDLSSFLALRPGLLESFNNITLTGGAISSADLLGSISGHRLVTIKVSV
jgi:hypothetical protein